MYKYYNGLFTHLLIVSHSLSIFPMEHFTPRCKINVYNSTWLTKDILLWLLGPSTLESDDDNCIFMLHWFIQNISVGTEQFSSWEKWKILIKNKSLELEWHRIVICFSTILNKTLMMYCCTLNTSRETDLCIHVVSVADPGLLKGAQIGWEPPA